MEIVNKDGLEYLSTFEDNSIDLILTDPPYITSRDTGMNTFYDNIKNDNTSRTEQDWEKYVEKNPKPIQTKAQRDNFLKYGTIYGKKYAVQTQYGNWDSEFTLEKLEDFVRLFFLKLRNGGTCIIFFDIWKITTLKDIMEKYGFKQIRFIEWIKTNPKPLNMIKAYIISRFKAVKTEFIPLKRILTYLKN
jgi:DNA modification methylase